MAVVALKNSEASSSNETVRQLATNTLTILEKEDCLLEKIINTASCKY